MEIYNTYKGRKKGFVLSVRTDNLEKSTEPTYILVEEEEQMECKCGKVVYVKGLCRSCYNKAWKLTEKGKASIYKNKKWYKTDAGKEYYKKVRDSKKYREYNRNYMRLHRRGLTKLYAILS